SKKDNDDNNAMNIHNNSNGNGSIINNHDVGIRRFTECSTYKEAERQIRSELVKKSMIEIRRLLSKLPDSISDWNNNNLEEAKAINVKKLDVEEIEILGLNGAQKILAQ